jgi:hypothetical protein
MPADVWAQIAPMLKPEALAVMAIVTVAWAVSQFFGVGEIADAVLLVVGGLTVGASAIDAGKEAVEFAVTAKGARTDAALEDAARHFGKAVTIGGVALITALFLRSKPKVLNDMKFGGPVGRLSTGPRSGRMFYRPTTTIAPIRQSPGFLTKGITTMWGDITIESRLSKADQAATLLHEMVHSRLTPKLYFLREVRVRVAMEGYNRSYLLRYLEEALAQTVAELRTSGYQGLPAGISFPVKNGYVTLAKMGEEVAGVLLGPVNAASSTYRVLYNAYKPATK